MKQPASTAAITPAAASQPKEKILFEIQPLMLPTILNLENLVMIGFTVVIVIAAVVFRFGLSEFIIVAALYLLIAVPSFRSIFRAGSTSYVLTNKRLIIFTVGFGPKERSIPLEQIQDVKTRTSGLQRFYGAGDIIVYQRTLGKPTRLLGLRECKRYAEAIQQAAKTAQRKA
jgi:membrane protein YdbS with pleckstrin-like domain